MLKQSQYFWYRSQQVILSYDKTIPTLVIQALD